jgi:hypothetical protein
MAWERDEEFWNTRFSKKYSTFGSEPRSDNLRVKGPRSKVDSGYLEWEYTEDWTFKNLKLNASRPRPQLAHGFGVLNSKPGPGEYGDQAHSFEHTSRFKSGGAFTVKGKNKKPPPPLGTKTPKELLSFKAKPWDPHAISKKNKKKKQIFDDTMDDTVALDPEMRKIKRMTETQLRQALEMCGQTPGPNAYRNAMKPFKNDRINNGYKRGPTSARLYAQSKGMRRIMDINTGVEIESQNRHSVPGAGTYDLVEEAGKTSTSVKIDPESQMEMTKWVSPAGPGSYDVVPAFEHTSRLSPVAKRIQAADFKKPYTRESTFH